MKTAGINVAQQFSRLFRHKIGIMLLHLPERGCKLRKAGGMIGKGDSRVFHIGRINRQQRRGICFTGDPNGYIIFLHHSFPLAASRRPHT